ncbi:uncharacterized protein LOC144444259 [Glandiceps talaboti]
MPDKLLMSGLITHLIGLVIVFTMGAGRSLLTIGCALDGELGDGRGVLYSHYITKQGNHIRNPHEESVSVIMDMDSPDTQETDEDYRDDGMEHREDVEIRSTSAAIRGGVWRGDDLGNVATLGK